MIPLSFDPTAETPAADRAALTFWPSCAAALRRLLRFIHGIIIPRKPDNRGGENLSKALRVSVHVLTLFCRKTYRDLCVAFFAASHEKGLPETRTRSHHPFVTAADLMKDSEVSGEQAKMDENKFRKNGTRRPFSPGRRVTAN